MKKILLIVFILCFVVFQLFAVNLSLGVSVDASSIWVRPLSIGGDLRLDILNELRIRVPLSFDKGNYYNLFTTGIIIDYSPFEKYIGMFFGFAVAEVGFLYRSSGRLQLVFLNEFQVGFRQSFFNNYLFFESILSIRDPFFIFSSSIKEIQNTIDSYSKFKFRLNIGVNFDLQSKPVKPTSKSSSSTKKKTTTKKT